MARIVTLATLLALLLAPAVAHAGGPAKTARLLDRWAQRAGPASGVYAQDLRSGRMIYSRNGTVPRIPASVNKLYTTAAALTRFGADGQLVTEVLGSRGVNDQGVLKGNVYVRGGGDPAFGLREAQGLAHVLARSGLKAVRGRVMGDESRFDSLRGGPDSRWLTSIWVGPLSALSFNHGRLLGSGAFQSAPAAYAAARVEDALEQRGVRVKRAARAGITPQRAVALGEWASPSMGRLAAQTNVPSDNFMAETLLKALGADFGGAGTTTAGAAVAKGVAGRFGAHPLIVDGSGLSRGNATAPRDVVRLLAGMYASDAGEAFYDSLAVAGRSGTLDTRMRGTRASGRCHAKTGTISAVSALAGYCEAKRRTVVAFAILMNGVDTWNARSLQDRMANVLARYKRAGKAPRRR
jgi:D-alanyl-D-alanine carboxypeptidase/D-alanyl-D-alanine-endopeptidase (penicillin-binding protein 4)